MNNVGRALARGCALARATALASFDANLTPDLLAAVLKHVLEAANIPLMVPSSDGLVCQLLNVVGRRQPCRPRYSSPQRKPRPENDKQRVISDEERGGRGRPSLAVYMHSPRQPFLF